MTSCYDLHKERYDAKYKPKCPQRAELPLTVPIRRVHNCSHKVESCDNKGKSFLEHINSNEKDDHLD